MHLVFMDESGYTLDWQSSIYDQPFYVTSAVCFPMDNIPTLYESLRNDISNLQLPGQSSPLGLGFEIKAKDIAKGAGWWGEHNEERNRVREMFLSSPRDFGGIAFVAVIDKQAHLDRYAFPDNPYFLAITFVLERVEMLLGDLGEYGYCIYDHNKRLESETQNHAIYLIRDGSHLIYFSKILDDLVIKDYRLTHLLELSLGVSKNSIGLQVADYFATMTYQYYKEGKPSPCGWWDTLAANLHTRDDQLTGIGLKEFP